jgi:two-component system response regulator FlrC
MAESLHSEANSSAVASAAVAGLQLVGFTMAELEQALILQTLAHYQGNRTRAANVLGISVRTLRNKINEYAAQGAMVTKPSRRSPRQGTYDSRARKQRLYRSDRTSLIGLTL